MNLPEIIKRTIEELEKDGPIKPGESVTLLSCCSPVKTEPEPEHHYCEYCGRGCGCESQD